MPRAQDNRADLRRALALNALTKPLNVLVPAVVVVAASLLGAVWLVPVAVVCWLALSAVTFFDEEEAARVGTRRRAGRRSVPAPPRPDMAALSPPIRSRLAAALEAQAAIRAAAEASELPLEDILQEIGALVRALETQALRAQRIDEFLAQRSPDTLRRRIADERSPAVAAALDAQLEAIARLRQRHADLVAEMDHVVASLETVHAEVLAVDGVDGAIQRRAVAGQVASLRTSVQLVSAGLEEAFEETRAHAAQHALRGEGRD